MAVPKQAGAPTWMVTFADLMALLLTLFVLMLSFSEMDLQRYESLAGSLREAFGVAKRDKLAGVIEIDGSLRRNAARDVDMSRTENPTTDPVPIPELSEEVLKQAKEARIRELEEELRKLIEDKMGTTRIELEREGDRVVIRFPSQLAFPSANAEVTPEFDRILGDFAEVLRQSPGEVVVSGHTDNVPIFSSEFRSNWDLSAARASSVIKSLLAKDAVQPGRVKVEGYADTRPIAPNDTPEGRAENRRVELSIVAD